MSKILVAYFSPIGTTAEAAENLAEVLGADLFEIKPAKPYTREDLDWHNDASRSSQEMKSELARPQIAAMPENLDSYDAVLVGFPIWWYVEPRIIDTFLEAYDFSGKTIIPFATSGGSGLGQAPIRMQKLCPFAKVLDGRVMVAGVSQSVVDDWVASL